MTLTTASALVTARADSTCQRVSLYRQGVAPTPGGYYSYWANNPVPAAYPASLAGNVPAAGDTGVPSLRTPASGSLYISRCTLATSAAASAGVYYVYDRLYQSGPYDMNSTSLQSVSSPPALTRPDANGENTELWLEVLANTVAGKVITVTYTNSAGTASQTTTLTTANWAAQQMAQFTLQGADTGVKSVQSFQLNATSAVATANLVIMRRLFPVAYKLGEYSVALDELGTGLPELYPTSALAVMSMQGNNSSSGNIVFDLEVVNA